MLSHRIAQALVRLLRFWLVAALLAGSTLFASPTRLALAQDLAPESETAVGPIDGFSIGADAYVYSLALQSDGKILVGGIFTLLGGVTRNAIARLNPDGSLDTGFDPNANGAVLALAQQADGKVLVGGHFTAIGGGSREFLVENCLYPIRYGRSDLPIDTSG